MFTACEESEEPTDFNWTLKSATITSLTRIEITGTCRINPSRTATDTVSLSRYIGLQTEPVFLPMAINLDGLIVGNGWRLLLTELHWANKQVALDLSSCTIDLINGNRPFNTGNVSYKPAGMDTIVSVILPSTATSIGEDAFRNCWNLTDITMPDSVVSIGRGAFSYCTGLTSVTIGNGVLWIGFEAFLGTGLTSVTIPASVTEIGDATFGNCSSLERITVASGNTAYRSEGNCLIRNKDNMLIAGTKTSVIPNSVTSIGDRAFEDCTSLHTVTVLATQPPSLLGQYGVNSVVFNTFDNTHPSLQIRVPATSVEEYQRSIGWRNYVIVACNYLAKKMTFPVTLSMGSAKTLKT